eukprot:TRINITY_DN11687_c0_g2_i8.p1 TRINITY_DN11687_c0_g2~~TRINITY_DN11687_c0_g2_i8.p1  ORF type:complete len:2048 (+),score=517.82 TRINITY_DN11687_c0_g2_i8:88-6231(+)
MPVEHKGALYNKSSTLGIGTAHGRSSISAKAAPQKEVKMTEEEKVMTSEEWLSVFEKYQKDIDFVKTGIDKGRYEDAIKDLDELLANIIYDTKISAHAVVVAFFKLNESLLHLHREISVDGYSASEQHWWGHCDRGRSLCIFTHESELRIFCGKLATSQTFDNIILILILIGTLCLAIDSPEQCTAGWCSSLEYVDLVINVIFTLEMFARVIYQGFYMSPTAYLQDGWLRMDFVVVVTGWLSLLDGFPNFKPFRAFKALKTVKAIRLLSYCAAVLDALVTGLPLFVDVFLVTGFLLLIFGIMGVQLFAASMHRKCQLIGSDENSSDDVLQLGAGMEGYCGQDLYGGRYESGDEDCTTNGVTAKCRLYSVDGFTCPRGFYCHVIDSSSQLANDGWTRFDNLGISSFTLFEMMTLEGWTPIMYAVQNADSTAASWYFVMIILLFAFIMVNLYIAVIVQTFAKIRRQRDEEAAEEREHAEELAAVKAEEIRVEAENRELSIRASNPLALVGPMKPDFGSTDMSPSEQIYTFLRSLQLESYYDSLLQMVETVDELYLLGEEDLLSAGWKLIHIRRLKDAALAPPVFNSNASFHGVKDWDPLAPTAKSPSEQMYAFLRGYNLEQYHPILVKLVDDLDELARLTVSDFECQGLKLIHARNLHEALIDRSIAMPQEGEGLLNPALIELLGGQSVGMWRASMQRGSQFWKSWFGSMLLSIWYRQDPEVDWEDPPPPAARTKFYEPYRWSGTVGNIIASDAFEGVISVAIFMNVIFLSLDYNKAPDAYRNMLAAMEFVFFIVFLSEMFLKFKGMGGLKWYFAVGFNQFDFVLVMSAWPAVIAYLSQSGGVINLSMLRVFRLFRIFKLIRSMRQLLDVVASAGKAIGNLMVFIFFFVLIFAIFGMQMFSGKVTDADGAVPRTNFDGTGGSLLALFQTMTGEDWTTIMWDVMREAPAVGLVFFIVFYVMANYILMEMFCAVILENFQLTREEKESLQRQLYDVLLAKRAASKALAASVDKELAEKMKAEMARREKEEAMERERKIRELNEGGTPQEKKVLTPEEQAAAEETRQQQEADLRDKITMEMKAAAAAGPDVPDAGLEYAEKDVGNSDTLILDQLDDQPKVKQKKNALPPSAIVEKTCYYFDQDNQFRQIMYQIEQTKAFEWSVFAAICLGCVFLALDTPYKPDPTAKLMITIVSPIILTVYNLEFMVKVVSKGFFGKPSAYIMDSWNRVDFLVLVLSDLAMFIQLIGYAAVLPSSIIMAFRTLRVIRPLRLINQNERIQIVFNALFLSLPAIMNVMTLLVFCIFMFSILGMGLYMGLFFSCNEDVVNENLCLGIGETSSALGYMVPTVWGNPRYDFDNVFSGMLVLFETSTLEGWVLVMYSCQDINGTPGGNDDPGLQPIENNEVMQCLYSVVYICFGVFFVLNLVTGVMIEKFNQISGRGILTEEQKMFKDTVLQAMLHDDRQPLGRPHGAVRAWCYSISQHENFEGGVLFLIMLNAGLMASEHYNQPTEWTTMLAILNLIFTIVFTIEITIRIIALYPKAFFADPWNVMDFLIVLVSLIMIPLNGIVNLTALRPFRLLLLFRVIKRAKGIRLMISTLLLSLPALFNVTCLLFLVYFIFSILGMTFWANIKFNEAIFSQAHFRTFPDALLMLARMTTGEQWNVMMRDCFVQPPDCTDYWGSSTDGWATDLGRTISNVEFEYTDPVGLGTYTYWLPNDCGNRGFSVIYFVSFMIVGSFCVINLFVAVILDNYAFMANVGDSEINEFVLDKFKKTWYRYTLADKHAGKHLGRYLRVAKLRSFLGDLGAPLGIVVWDAEGRARYKMIREEVRAQQTPGLGIAYRKMQYILCLVHMGPGMMPHEDKVRREDYLNELSLARAAVAIQAMYKGKHARQKLGVKRGAATADTDNKAVDFKKRFLTMLNNPNALAQTVQARQGPTDSSQPAWFQQQPTAAAKPTPAKPAAAERGSPKPTGSPKKKISLQPKSPTPPPVSNASVGIEMSSLQNETNPLTDVAPQGSMEADVGEVRNIFKQRAAARAKAAKAKAKGRTSFT